uniref:Uncharacterized protein n=1 Tax=Rhizophora mucronata TaxID=61149 RepID=A0A2P2PBH6_RHIMU
MILSLHNAKLQLYWRIRLQFKIDTVVFFFFP